MDAQRALLDQLMGSQRDVPDHEKKEMHFWDRRVDKFWLVGLQPFDIFKNTLWSPKMAGLYRHALGREYDPDVEQPLDVLPAWERLSDAERDAYGYEHELHAFLVALVEACDKSVARAREAHEAKATEVTGEEAAKVFALDEQIKKVEKEAERAGEAGDVDTSLALMAQIDAINAQKAAIIRPTGAAAQVRKVLVCEVSGNVVQNTEIRIQEHYSGRLYLGWKAVRDRLAITRPKYAHKPSPNPFVRRRARALVDDAEGKTPSAAKAHAAASRPPPPHHHRRDDRDRRRDRDDGRSRDRRRSRSRSRDRSRSRRDRDRSRDRRGRDGPVYRYDADRRDRDRHRA